MRDGSTTNHQLIEELEALRAHVDALERENERLSLTTAGSNDGLWDWPDLSVDKQWWSPRLYELLGYDDGEFEPTLARFAEFLHPDDRESCVAEIETITRSCGRLNAEYRIKTKQGDYRWLEARGQVFGDEFGEPARMAGSVRDITERKLTEDALSSSQAIQQLLLEHAPVALAMFDLDMRYLAASRGWREICNLGDQKILGISHYEVHQEIPDRWKAIHQRCLAGEVIRNDDDRWDHADGSTQLLEWEVRPWYAADGEIGGIVIFSRDITEGRQTEEALRVSEERLESALAGAELGLWDWDVQSGNVIFNERWAEMLGYQLDEIEPRVETWEELVHPDDLLRITPVLNAHLEGATSVYETEHRLRHKSGEWVWVLDKGRVVERGPDGKALRVCGTHLDITARKHAEERLSETEALLKAAMDHSQVAILIADAPDGRVRYMNDAAAALGGRRKEDSVDSVQLVDYPEAWPIRRLDGTPYQPADIPLTRAIQKGETCSEEYLLRSANGEEHVMWCKAGPIRNSEGEVVRGIIVSLDVTDRYRTEEALRQSEKRLIAAQRIAKMGDFTWDPETGEVTWSRALFDLLRYDQTEEFDYLRVNKEIHHPDDMERVHQWLIASVEAGESILPPNEYRLVRGDGSIIHVRTMGTIERDNRKHPLVFGSVQDVTESVLTREALQESERRLTTLMNNLPGMAYRCQNDLYWTMDFVSDGCESLTGYRPEELEANARVAFAHLIVPDDRQRVRDTVDEALSARRSFEIVYRITTVDGTFKWVWEQGQGIFGDDGTVVALEGFITDITQQRRTELELRASEDRFRGALENIPDVIVIYDRDLRIQYINAATRSLTGRRTSDFIGHRDDELWPPEVYEAYIPTVQSSLDKKAARSIETDIELPVGGKRSLSITCVPLLDDSGEVREILGITHDLTERKRAEETITRHRDQLEELVQERTTELEQAHERLLNQERLATLGQLTATVGHELRNPLGTLRSSVFTIKDSLGELSEEMVEILDRAERSIVRCNTIIEELLDYTRTRQIVPTVTRIDEWAGRIVDEQPVRRSVTVRKRLSSGVEIAVDVEKLRRCLINMITNAVQAVEENKTGRGKLTIETVVVNDRLEIRVSDTGPGIPPDRIEKVFEPLFSTKGFGVGLGLPIVRQIAEAHSGGVELASELGRGTTATLWLPLRDCGSKP